MTKEGSFAWRDRVRCARSGFWLPLFLLAFSWDTPAWALAPEDVPGPLKPWVPWVLEQLGDRVCPTLAGEPACVWPGRLELELDDAGGRFRLHLRVDRPSSVALPGGEAQWPQDVQVDGAGAVVFEQGGAPVVALAAGQHVLEGRFAWRRLPETLIVPGRIALLQLGVGGQPVKQPKRDGVRLWLRGEQAVADEPESLTVEVFRKLEDQAPFSVRTQLVLQVSGRSRELRVPTALTPGSLPFALESQLPARIEPNGELSLQVYAGRHEIQIDALYPTPPDRVSAPRHPPPGPASEIWVFVPHGEHRQTEVKGASIDPERSNLPKEWRGFAAYQLDAGSELVLETLGRGQPHPPPNRLLLERELWLDLDGEGYTARDRLSGALYRTWRLDLLDGQLGHAAVGGVDQLITTHPTSGARGVELRRGVLDMSAEFRLDGARGTLPAVAWSENVEQLAADLHLPPGWQLLGASGADSVSQSWIGRWDLFALFFVLVVAVAVAKLDRLTWGLLALFALMLAHDEPHAQRLTWVAILLCIALLHAIPAGRFRQLVRAVALVSSLALLGSTVSFAVHQIRAALYPQVDDTGGMFELQKEGGFGVRSQVAFESSAELAAPAAAPAPAEAPGLDADRSMGGAAQKRANPIAAYIERGHAFSSDSIQDPSRSASLEQDPNAQIQTGPGVPSWTWRTSRLAWSGPVARTHTVQLYLVSPAVNALLSLLRIGLLGALTYWALRRLWSRARRVPPDAAAPRPSATATALTIGLAGLCASAPARADIPTPELLEQLKARVQPPRACEGACVQVPRLALEAAGDELRLDAEVHAAERGAYQLPGPASVWLPTSVELDGQAASALLLGDDGYLQVRVEPGRHRLRARGVIAGRQLSIDPGTRPRWVTVDAPGWEVSGLSERGQIDGALGLVRPLPKEGARTDGAEEAATTLPTWATSTRTLSFGVSWKVRTELRRMSPRGSVIDARVRLLPGERVTSAGVTVSDGVALLRLAGDRDDVSFDSVLDPRPELALTAPASAGYSERWIVRCSPIYRCESRGVAPIAHESAGRWEPVYAPWPGETLHLSVARPLAATGQTATIDSARLELHPGVRSQRAELTARVRVSTPMSYRLELPEGSEIDQLSIGGRNEPIRQQGSQLELVFAPGQHDLMVGWQQPEGQRALFRTPRVSFGSELINAEVSVHLPQDRWLLAAGGPGWGPAILLWGHLLLIVLLAPVLARLPRSPLRAWQWALLALGLTQVPLPVAGVILGWFFIMAFQDRGRPESPFWFNARQLASLALTLVFLGCLFGAVYDSLLNTPNMEVAGGGSSERLLRWYVDRTSGALPGAWVLTTSLWVWRAIMLLWALWLAHSLVGWLQWAWRELSSTGVWKPWRKAAAKA